MREATKNAGLSNNYMIGYKQKRKARTWGEGRELKEEGAKDLIVTILPATQKPSGALVALVATLSSFARLFFRGWCHCTRDVLAGEGSWKDVR